MAQVQAPFEAFSKGVVPPYVRKALELMRDKARDNSYQSWQLDQQQLLLRWLAESKDSQTAFEAELLRTDPVLLPISSPNPSLLCTVLHARFNTVLYICSNP